MKTYHGSCHCGAIRFEADIEDGAGTGRCNCSICSKRRAWNMLLKPDQFRLISGEDVLTDYQFGTGSGHHLFCSRCGCAPFSRGFVEQLGGDIVAVQPSCLDDMTDEELGALSISYANGRDNLWWEEPAVRSHL
jgi:hypothetical protein